jgi:hypothetical protein
VVFFGTPVSSTNKTDCHDITEIFFESGVKHHKPTEIWFLYTGGYDPEVRMIILPEF